MLINAVQTGRFLGAVLLERLHVVSWLLADMHGHRCCLNRPHPRHCYFRVASCCFDVLNMKSSTWNYCQVSWRDKKGKLDEGPDNKPKIYQGVVLIISNVYVIDFVITYLFMVIHHSDCEVSMQPKEFTSNMAIASHYKHHLYLY